jgi:hypothetical protein
MKHNTKKPLLTRPINPVVLTLQKHTTTPPNYYKQEKTQQETEKEHKGNTTTPNVILMS